MVDAREAVPHQEVHLRDIDRSVLGVWSATWAGLHPSGFGGFDWKERFYTYCRSERAFHISVWSEDVLCGLAIGVVPKDHSSLTVVAMAGKQNPPNPLKGRVMGIVERAAEYYAEGLKVPIIILENPAPGLIDIYEAELGYVLAHSPERLPYLMKRL